MPVFHIGGQAVIEGVMMRGEREWSVAVRTPDGEIVTKKEPVGSLTQRYPMLKKPVIRGVVSLVETLALGIKALSFSANAALGAESGEAKEEPISVGEWAGTIAVAAVVIVGLFMVTPYFLTRFVSEATGGNRVLFALVEGLFRITIFLGYIFTISRLKDIQRVFQYHGAEHKAINALEAGEELTPENADKYTTLNVRCGTSFLLIVMVVAIVTFSFLPTSSVVTRVLGKLALVPLVSGLAYEVMKFAAKHPQSPVLNALVWPGMMLQKLTTKPPDRSQIEVAIVALKDVLPKEQTPAH